MSIIESLSLGAFFGFFSFGICFPVIYNYFRKHKLSRTLKYSFFLSGIYGLVTFILVFTLHTEPQLGESPDLGVMLGVIMVVFAAVINIPIHYLLKWYREGYYNRKK